MIVKRIDPVSAGKITAVIYAALGFIVAVLMFLLSMLGGGLFPMTIGIAAIILWPIIAGVLGFINTVIAAWVYNMAAGAVGGIQIEVE